MSSRCSTRWRRTCPSLESAALSAEAHRQKSEARFRSLVGNASDLITVVDADDVVAYQGPSIDPVLGYSPEETEGRRFDRVHSATDLQRFARTPVRPRGGNRAAPRGIRLLHIDGRLHQCEMRVTDLLEAELVGGLVLNSRDVTERNGARGRARPPGVPRPADRPRQPGAVPRPGRPRPGSAPAAPAGSSRCCSSTSTTSRP